MHRSASGTSSSRCRCRYSCPCLMFRRIPLRATQDHLVGQGGLASLAGALRRLHSLLRRRLLLPLPLLIRGCLPPFVRCAAPPPFLVPTRIGSCGGGAFAIIMLSCCLDLVGPRRIYSFPSEQYRPKGPLVHVDEDAFLHPAHDDGEMHVHYCVVGDTPPDVKTTTTTRQRTV